MFIVNTSEPSTNPGSSSITILYIFTAKNCNYLNAYHFNSLHKLPINPPCPRTFEKGNPLEKSYLMDASKVMLSL